MVELLPVGERRIQGDPYLVEDAPLAEQVLDFLDIPVPDEEDIDQVLPAGDLSIFADLGLDEMELAAICSRLDVESDDDLLRVGSDRPGSGAERHARAGAENRSAAGDHRTIPGNP